MTRRTRYTGVIAPAPYVQPEEIRARDYVPSYHPSYRPREDNTVALRESTRPLTRVPTTHLVQSDAKLAKARKSGVAAAFRAPKKNGPVARLMAVIRECPEGVAPAVLASAANLHVSQIGPYLKSYIAKGVVIRDPERRVWRLADE